MDTVAYQSMYLQSMAQTAQLPGGQTAGTSGSGDFQELLDRAQNPKDVELPQGAQNSQNTQNTKDTKETPKSEVKEKTPAADKENAPQTEENPQKTLEQLVKEGVVVPVGILVDSSVAQEMLGMNLEPETDVILEPLAVEELVPAGELADGLIEQASAAPQEAVQPEVQPEQLIQQPEAAEEAPQAEVQVQEQAPVQETVETAATETHPEENFSAETGAQKDSDGEVTVGNAGAQPQVVFHDVEAAPIKVGETYTAQQSGEPESVENQLAGPLTEALAQGESRVQIQLEPENLGSVTVEITQSTDGGLHVALSAESVQTRGLLEKHTENLQALLGARGQEIRVEVQRQEESQQGQNDHPYDGHNGNAQQEQQRQGQQNHRQQSEQQVQDFLQQLRLGLIPADAEVS